MPITPAHLQEAAEAVAREGQARILPLPVAEADPACPAPWRSLLQSRTAADTVFDLLWGPAATLLPRTIAAWRRSLQGLALLTTRKHPASLVYFYQRDGESYAWRGFAPRPISPAGHRPETARLPAEFRRFYLVHDGFNDLFSGALGPLPEAQWFPLGQDPAEPAASFLVVFSNGGGAHLGFDLSEPQPLPYIVWPDAPPTLVTDLWSTLDEWMAISLEGATPNT